MRYFVCRVRTALVVWSVFFALFLFCPPATGCGEETPPPEETISVQDAAAEESLRVWEPQNRITPQEATNMIWSLAGICVLGFLVFALLTIIFREQPARPSKSFPKLPKKKENLSFEDEDVV